MRYILYLFVATSLLSCSKFYPVDTGVGTGKGIVRRVDSVHRQLTLAHGTVSKLLHPMTYAYPVKNDAMLVGLVPGDSVTFSIEERAPGDFMIQSVRKIRSAAKK